jgi:hypothetical protein
MKSIILPTIFMTVGRTFGDVRDGPVKAAHRSGSRSRAGF